MMLGSVPAAAPGRSFVSPVADKETFARSLTSRLMSLGSTPTSAAAAAAVVDPSRDLQKSGTASFGGNWSCSPNGSSNQRMMANMMMTMTGTGHLVQQQPEQLLGMAGSLGGAADGLPDQGRGDPHHGNAGCKAVLVDDHDLPDLKRDNDMHHDDDDDDDDVRHCDSDLFFDFDLEDQEDQQPPARRTGGGAATEDTSSSSSGGFELQRPLSISTVYSTAYGSTSSPGSDDAATDLPLVGGVKQVEDEELHLVNSLLEGLALDPKEWNEHFAPSHWLDGPPAGTAATSTSVAKATSEQDLPIEEMGDRRETAAAAADAALSAMSAGYSSQASTPTAADYSLTEVTESGRLPRTYDTDHEDEDHDAVPPPVAPVDQVVVVDRLPAAGNGQDPMMALDGAAAAGAEQQEGRRGDNDDDDDDDDDDDEDDEEDLSGGFSMTCGGAVHKVAKEKLLKLISFLEKDREYRAAATTSRRQHWTTGADGRGVAHPVGPPAPPATLDDDSVKGQQQPVPIAQPMSSRMSCQDGPGRRPVVGSLPATAFLARSPVDLSLALWGGETSQALFDDNGSNSSESARVGVSSSRPRRRKHYFFGRFQDKKSLPTLPSAQNANELAKLVAADKGAMMGPSGGRLRRCESAPSLGDAFLDIYIDTRNKKRSLDLAKKRPSSPAEATADSRSQEAVQQPRPGPLSSHGALNDPPQDVQQEQQQQRSPAPTSPVPTGPDCQTDNPSSSLGRSPPSVASSLSERCPLEAAADLEGEAADLEDEDGAEDEDQQADSRAKYRRSSSLKSGKTPPGTPCHKKIVRFADLFGLDLADVKTYMDGVPKVPKCAFKDLKNAEISDLDSDSGSDRSLLKGYSPVLGGHYSSAAGLCGPSSSSKRPPGFNSRGPRLVPMFSQPAGTPNLYNNLRDKKVSLEMALVNEAEKVVRGTVRVVNMDYHKQVTVRFTTDDWRSDCELDCKYLNGSCDGFSDTFSFSVECADVFGRTGRRLQMCFRFRCLNSEFWDNNNSANYVFQYFPGAPASSSAPLPLKGALQPASTGSREDPTRTSNPNKSPKGGSNDNQSQGNNGSSISKRSESPQKAAAQPRLPVRSTLSRGIPRSEAKSVYTPLSHSPSAMTDDPWGHYL